MTYHHGELAVGPGYPLGGICGMCGLRAILAHDGGHLSSGDPGYLERVALAGVVRAVLICRHCDRPQPYRPVM